MSITTTVAACKQVPLCFGPSVWLDCSNPNGNQVLPSNGASVASVKDLSGNQNHFTQGTVAQQPTFSAAFKNGLGALTFTSTQTVVSPNPCVGMTFDNNPRSLFLVFYWQNAVSGQNNGIWSQGGGGNGNNTFFGHYNATNANLGVDSGGTGQYITFSPTLAATTTFYIWDYTNASGNLLNAVCNINGVANTVANHGYPGAFAGIPTSSAVTLNGFGTGAVILEVIAYSYQLSAVQRLQVYNYLKNKWNI